MMSTSLAGDQGRVGQSLQPDAELCRVMRDDKGRTVRNEAELVWKGKKGL